MSTYASCTIGDLKFTEKSIGSQITITYDNGGLAYVVPEVQVDLPDITVKFADKMTRASAIKSAIEAHPIAKDLVTVTVVGTATNVQSTLNGTNLSEGQAPTYAYVDLGPLRVKARTYGSVRNGYRFRLHANPIGTADSLTTSGTDYTINVQPSGLADWYDVRMAILNDASCSGIFDASPYGANLSAPIDNLTSTTAYLTTAHGTSGIFPSGIAGNVIFEYVGTGTPDELPAGSYNALIHGSGVVAGSETFRLTQTGIEGYIQTGVSTATQVVTAFMNTAAMSGVAAHGSFTVEHTDLDAPTSGCILTVNDTTVANGIDWDFQATEALTASDIYDALTTASPTGVSVSLDGTHINVDASAKGLAGNEIEIGSTLPGFVSVFPSGSLVSNSPYETTLQGGLGGWTARTTGTASTKQVSAYKYPLAGGVQPSSPNYFVDNSATALTSSFVKFSWGYNASEIVITNNEASGSNTVIGSFDGINTDFTVLPTRQLTLEHGVGSFVYLKYGTGAPSYSVTVMP